MRTVDPDEAALSYKVIEPALQQLCDDLSEALNVGRLPHAPQEAELGCYRRVASRTREPQRVPSRRWGSP